MIAHPLEYMVHSASTWCICLMSFDRQVLWSASWQVQVCWWNCPFIFDSLNIINIWTHVDISELWLQLNESKFICLPYMWVWLFFLKDSPRNFILTLVNWIICESKQFQPISTLVLRLGLAPLATVWGFAQRQSQNYTAPHKCLSASPGSDNNKTSSRCWYC